MSAIRIANRYAKSILQLAIEKGQLEEVNRDMEMLNVATDDSRDFYLMLKSPIIHADKKMAVINGVFGNKLTSITSNFLEILVRKGREGFLPDVIDVFRNMYNAHKGITEVELRTAYELSEQTRQAIMDRLRSMAGLQEIRMKTTIDDSLIGGYVLRFEDKLIDTSIQRG
ncbi:MAG TPA: ATP synthase F1 subunit delta, partial [Chitinophagales bacterium]|nr:ATP synthase F1 subunit delta [Chitinophagales bacterium]